MSIFSSRNKTVSQDSNVLCKLSFLLTSFSTTVAHHGLLQADLSTSVAEEEKQDDDDADQKATNLSSQKVHPLALASARLQANGITELNRAINLAGLVSSGEYFGLANVVDSAVPSSGDLPSAADGTNESKANRPTDTTTSTLKVVPDPSDSHEQKVKASFILKRKRAQFETATQVVQRHQKRLVEAIER